VCVCVCVCVYVMSSWVRVNDTVALYTTPGALQQ